MAEATKETILVVDDVDLVLGLVVLILKGAHYNVLQANSGTQALKVAADYPASGVTQNRPVGITRKPASCRPASRTRLFYLT